MAKGWTDRAAKTKLGGLLFKSDDLDGGQEIQREPAQAATMPATSVPAVFGSSGATSAIPLSFTSPNVSSNIDPEVRGKLQAIADGADQVSYTKFRELVKSMKSSFNDEASCYRAAFAAGKAFNLPASEVLRGLDAILNELAQTERKFKAAAPQRIAAKVGARREKIAQIQQAVSAKNEEMKRLHDQLSRLNSEVVQLSQAEQSEQVAIAQDEQSVREDSEKFTVALESVKTPYVAERQKIELYGKGA